MHIQKTFSLPIEKYKPGMCNEQFHNTEQQLEYLREARQRSKEFISKNPLPANANQEKLLGLLTVCAEHIIAVANAKNYIGLHEKADRPVLSIRHILHYVKKNICNEAECGWFAEMFKNQREDIQRILCKNNYKPDYKGNHGEYGNDKGSGQYYRYDVIFDLFGDFKNGCSLPEQEEDNRLTDDEFQMGSYGITSWKALLNNHISNSGRNHFRLQKVKTANGNTEYHPLFEARRIGLMTTDEFKKGKSRVSLTESTTPIRQAYR